MSANFNPSNSFIKEFSEIRSEISDISKLESASKAEGRIDLTRAKIKAILENDQYKPIMSMPWVKFNLEEVDSKLRNIEYGLFKKDAKLKPEDFKVVSECVEKVFGVVKPEQQFVKKWEAAIKIADSEDRAKALMPLINELIEAGDYEKVTVAIKYFESPDLKAEIFNKLLIIATKNKDFLAAIKYATLIPIPDKRDERLKYLIGIMMDLEGSKRSYNVSTQCIYAASAILNRASRERALLNLNDKFNKEIGISKDLLGLISILLETVQKGSKNINENFEANALHILSLNALNQEDFDEALDFAEKIPNDILSSQYRMDAIKKNASFNSKLSVEKRVELVASLTDKNSLDYALSNIKKSLDPVEHKPILDIIERISQIEVGQSLYNQLIVDKDKLESIVFNGLSAIALQKKDYPTALKHARSISNPVEKDKALLAYINANKMLNSYDLRGLVGEFSEVKSEDRDIGLLIILNRCFDKQIKDIPLIKDLIGKLSATNEIQGWIQLTDVAYKEGMNSIIEEIRKISIDKGSKGFDIIKALVQIALKYENPKSALNHMRNCFRSLIMTEDGCQLNDNNTKLILNYLSKEKKLEPQLIGLALVCIMDKEIWKTETMKFIGKSSEVNKAIFEMALLDRNGRSEEFVQEVSMAIFNNSLIQGDYTFAFRIIESSEWKTRSEMSEQIFSAWIRNNNKDVEMNTDLLNSILYRASIGFDDTGVGSLIDHIFRSKHKDLDLALKAIEKLSYETQKKEFNSRFSTLSDPVSPKDVENISNSLFFNNSEVPHQLYTVAMQNHAYKTAFAATRYLEKPFQYQIPLLNEILNEKTEKIDYKLVLDIINSIRIESFEMNTKLLDLLNKNITDDIKKTILSKIKFPKYDDKWDPKFENNLLQMIDVSVEIGLYDQAVKFVDSDPKKDFDVQRFSHFMDKMAKVKIHDENFKKNLIQALNQYPYLQLRDDSQLWRPLIPYIRDYALNVKNNKENFVQGLYENAIRAGDLDNVVEIRLMEKSPLNWQAKFTIERSAKEIIALDPAIDHLRLQRTEALNLNKDELNKKLINLNSLINVYKLFPESVGALEIDTVTNQLMEAANLLDKKLMIAGKWSDLKQESINLMSKIFSNLNEVIQKNKIAPSKAAQENLQHAQKNFQSALAQLEKYKKSESTSKVEQALDLNITPVTRNRRGDKPT